MTSQEALDEFKVILHELVDNAGKITEDNTLVGHELFANMAKLDHMIYKNNAYSSVFENKIDMALSDHTTCNLGKWYADDGKKQFSNTPAFKEILEPHKKVHDNIAKVMEILKTQEVNKNADVIIKLFKEAEATSQVLFKHLDDIVQR